MRSVTTSEKKQRPVPRAQGGRREHSPSLLTRAPSRGRKADAESTLPLCAHAQPCQTTYLARLAARARRARAACSIPGVVFGGEWHTAQICPVVLHPALWRTGAPSGCHLRLDRLDRLDSDGRVRSAHKLRARPGLKGMGPRTSPSRATGLHVAPPSATLACRANTCTSLAVDGACALARARFALCACEAAGGVRCDRCGGAECEQRRAPGGWMRGGRC